MEIWKDIIWCEWLYQASNLGNIRSVNKYSMNWHNLKWKIMSKTKRGWYCAVNIYKNWVINTVYVHRLVALTFILNPENKPQINHINGIKYDNRLENLEWCTVSENIRHKFDVLNMKWPRLWISWKCKKVKQFTKQWIFIKTWNNTMDITTELWLYSWNISLCCNWKLKTSWWFIWKYI